MRDAQPKPDAEADPGISRRTQREHRLTPEETARLDADGYVVRAAVFSRDECVRIAADCERLVDTLAALKSKHGKFVVGSYMFEPHRDFDTTVKWEPDAPELIQGIEPFAHLSPPLEAWGLDPRLVDPARDVSGAPDVVMFTEKLNLKRAHKGGPIVLHQDFPYWESFAPAAAQISTAMVFLDDATIENGCLEVAPGTHKVGKHAQRTDADGFGSLEMDPGRFDMSRLIPLEVAAGSVAYFGAFLVHRSLPNRSGGDRRALLYSYQPAGNQHARVLMKAAHRAQQQAAAAQ